MTSTNDADFCIEIKFDKEDSNPSRIFKAMNELIDGFIELDKILVSSIDNRIEPILMLEDIETGSLRTWLRNKLVCTDDALLGDLDWKKVVGRFLVNAKYIIIDFLDKKTKIQSREDLVELKNRLFDLSKKKKVKQFPEYTPISEKKLSQSIGYIAKPLKNLSRKDVMKYIYEDKEVEFNQEFEFVPDEIEELITSEELTSETLMILKVKKPDYLGDSKWEFKHGIKSICAKILHDDWLQKFQKREIDIRPMDAVRAKVRVTVKYGYDLNEVSTIYEIIEVLSVIHAGEDNLQLKISSNNEEKEEKASGTDDEKD